MTTTVTVTGTGVPHLSPGRAGPGVLVRHGDVALQFDAGRATALRMCEVGLELGELTALFVTHHHSDHLTGLTDLLMARWLENHGRFTPLPIVVPDGPATRLLERLMDPWEDDIDVRRRHVDRHDHPAPEIVPFNAEPTATAIEVWRSEHGSVAVSARAVHHEPVAPAVAYRVDTPDGAVVISGDTIVCDEVADLAAGADVLVHEACRTEALRPMFDTIEPLRHITKYHADTIELGALAERVGVPTLILTHLIPAPGTGPVTAACFEDDVRRGGYQGQVVVAEDLHTTRLGDVDPPSGHPDVPRALP